MNIRDCNDEYDWGKARENDDQNTKDSFFLSQYIREQYIH